MRSPLSTSNEVWQQQFSDDLRLKISEFPQTSQFILGCSGGIDSMLLLHLFAFLLPQRLKVISIDHQLQTESTSWSKQVAELCHHYQVDCQIIAVNVGVGNVEAAARQARYQAFEECLNPNDVLILGHHQQDQAETVMLRLLQGSGVQGLSAMTELEKRLYNKGCYHLWRPMLSLNKKEIETWASQLDFPFVHDPMNSDEHYDRVWCRQQLWPVLEQRFPKMQQAIARSALLMQDADEILNEVLQQDYADCIDAQNLLDIFKFEQKSEARQRQLLSKWMQADQNYRPALAMVERLKNEVIYAKQDAQSQLHSGYYWFVRFGGYIYRYSDAQWQNFEKILNIKEISFSFEDVTEIALGQVKIESCVDTKIGLSPQLLGQKLQLVPRQGGERLKILGRSGSRPLKKLLQDAKIAPWFRHQIQILMYHNEILGVFTPQGFWLVENSFCVQDGWLPQLLVK